MAPASKRDPISDESGSEDDDDEDDSGSENGVVKEEEEAAIPQIDVDVSKLTPLSPEVIQKQATINIGESWSV